MASPLRRGVAGDAYLEEWTAMHEGLGFTPTKISEMKEIAQRFSRAVTADIRTSAGIALQENNLMVVPQYYWMPVSADDINTSPKPEATVNTEAKAVAEGDLDAAEPAVPWNETPDTAVSRFADQRIAVVTPSDGQSPMIYEKKLDGEWRAPIEFTVQTDTPLVFGQRRSIKGKSRLCLITRSEQFCREAREDNWSRQSMLSPKNHQLGDVVMALPHRPHVWIATSSRGGLLRSIDAGQNWRLAESTGQYIRFGYFGPKADRLICAHSQTTQTVNGIDCSTDDGRTWRPYLRANAPITLKTFEDELILAVGPSHLRLVRLIDRGSVQDALLFVGQERRLSKTGRWFLDKLEEPLKKTNDILLVSRSVQPIAEGDTQPENRSLRLQAVGSQIFERWRFKNPSDRRWNYAIVTPLLPKESR